jgi:tetratricopeptide (TPR) repeat protein
MSRLGGNLRAAVMGTLGCCLTFCSVGASGAQDLNEVTPQVQQLYSEAHAAQASGDAATAISKYLAMLRLAPHLAPAYNNLGMLYFNGHNYPEAATTLARGLALDPNMPGAEAMLGMSYLEMGEAGKAEAPLQAAVNAGSVDEQVQVSLARAELATGHKEKAAATLQAFTVLHPKDQQAWYLLGKTYLQLSEAALGKVNEIDPNSVYAHEIAGEVDAGMQNYQGALVEYKRAVDAAPQQPGVHMHMADAYWALNEWSSAEKEYREELGTAPHNCQASWKLGNSILEESGTATKPQDDPLGIALDAENIAVRECPTLVQARVDRARALVKLHRGLEALPDLEIAVKQAPNEPSVRFLLAEVYRVQGKRAEALEQMQIYARLQQDATAMQAKQAGASMQIQAAAH